MRPLSLPDTEEYLATYAGCAKSGTQRTISEIPDEILEKVFLEDVLRDKDLCAIALVNRRFSRLIQRSLYNQIELPLATEKHMCFKRTLMDCPKLGSFVRDLALPADDDADPDYFIRELPQLLKTMSALHCLSLPMTLRNVDKLTSLLVVPMSRLAFLSLRIDGGLNSKHLVTEAFSIPQLKMLHIVYDCRTMGATLDELIDRHTTILRGFGDALFGSSSVKHLFLSLWPDLIVLESNLLRIPCALKKLTCRFDYAGELTPKEIIDALDPLYSTLVSLDLSYCFYEVDLIGPVADFSCFKRLQTLAVDGSLCFDSSSGERPEERRGFYRRLPTTLKVLEVSVSMAFHNGLEFWLTL
jgi:hypothetical protein